MLLSSLNKPCEWKQGRLAAAWVRDCRLFVGSIGDDCLKSLPQRVTGAKYGQALWAGWVLLYDHL